VTKIWALAGSLTGKLNLSAFRDDRDYALTYLTAFRSAIGFSPSKIPYSVGRWNEVLNEDLKFNIDGEARCQ
jgi:hypothetical protein